MTAAPAVLRTRPVLVTGGAGFIGSNLVDRLATRGEDVLVYDVLARPGVERNLAWLRRRHPQRVSVAVADLLDRPALAEAAARASSVFHLAAQVAVTTSLDDPEHDFDVNLRGTVFLLEALRRRRDKPPLVFASTNKVYGSLSDLNIAEQDGAHLPVDPVLRAHGIGEDRPLRFYTPLRLLQGCGGPVCAGLRPRLWPAGGRAAHELHLRPAPDGYGRSGPGWRISCSPSWMGVPSASTAMAARCATCCMWTMRSAPIWAARERIGTVSGQAFNLGGGAANAVTCAR